MEEPLCFEMTGRELGALVLRLFRELSESDQQEVLGLMRKLRKAQ